MPRPHAQLAHALADVRTSINNRSLGGHNAIYARLDLKS